MEVRLAIGLGNVHLGTPVAVMASSQDQPEVTKHSFQKLTPHRIYPFEAVETLECSDFGG